MDSSERKLTSDLWSIPLFIYLFGFFLVLFFEFKLVWAEPKNNINSSSGSGISNDAFYREISVFKNTVIIPMHWENNDSYDEGHTPSLFDCVSDYFFVLFCFANGIGISFRILLFLSFCYVFVQILHHIYAFGFFISVTLPCPISHSSPKTSFSAIFLSEPMWYHRF